jgi:3-methyl-2-oxobutanoate hydroxymethyltransferase
MTVLEFQQKKRENKKISMVTCYDYTSAKILAQTSVDCLLVGDSVAMTMHGYKNTLYATMEMMCLHTAAVSRGAGEKFIVSDMPFLSYRKSFSDSMLAVQSLMQSGASAVKLEGADGNTDLVKHIVESGIPVMGHLGLTPQSVHQLGGYKVQGKTAVAAAKLKQDALALQQAGCFCIVLECVPAQLAADITRELAIPTIGIGAGAATNGQVLVYQDLLGLDNTFKPKFVKTFLDGSAYIRKAIESYVNDVHSGEFPRHEHSY